jgi:6-phosphogluconolactonase
VSPTDRPWQNGVTRRQLLLTLSAAPLLSTFGERSFASADATLVYVGTYTSAKSKGIYLFRLQSENAGGSERVTLAPLGVAAETPNPSFLALDPARRLLFAVNELDIFQGKPTGAVSAFSIDAASGALTLLNQQPSMGTSPCHLTLSADGRHLFVANYSSGSVSVLPIGTDGRLSPASDVVQHNGHSVHPERQQGPHAHCVTLDPAKQFLWVCDLGLDKVLAYRFDARRGRLTPHDPPFAPLKAGAGPRHMIFRPDGRFAYVGNELNSTITVFRYDSGAGVLHDVQTVSTLPKSFDGANTVAEIDVHPSGRWVYASNRGHNSVVLFNVDADHGTLTDVEAHGAGVAKPRHFGIDPSAQHLAIANQDANTVIVTRIDPRTGRLTPSGAPAQVPTPVCVKFLPQ